MGAERVAASVRAYLDGVAAGVTLEPVFCLGLCAVAPAALLDGRPLGRIDAEAITVALEAAPP